jgi:hypothetical protein
VPGPLAERATDVVQLATHERQVEREVLDAGGDLPGVARRARDAGEVGSTDDEPMAREVRRQVVVVEARATGPVRDQDERIAPRQRLGVPPRAPCGIPDLGRERPVPATRVDRIDGRDADRELSGSRRIGGGRRGGREREHDQGNWGATHVLFLAGLVRAIQAHSAHRISEQHPSSVARAR